MVTPNRIVLISQGRHDEAPGNNVNVYPGMILQETSGGAVVPHNVIGGGLNTTFNIAKEDALQGGDITQVIGSAPYGTTAVTSTGTNVVSFQRASKGDVLLGLLQNGQNVAQDAALMSGGDGTVIAAIADPAFQIVAPSAVVTNQAAETAFSNGSYTIPANVLAVGDVIKVRVKMFCIAENTTNTHRLRTYIGAAPLTLADSGALQLAANDVVVQDITITVRSITAAGTIIADALQQWTVSGTWATSASTLVSSTLDSTVSETIVSKVLASAQSANNQVRLDEFSVRIIKAAGPMQTLCYAAEAQNNSGGTGTSGFNSAMFIRIRVP